MLLEWSRAPLLQIESTATSTKGLIPNFYSKTHFAALNLLVKHREWRFRGINETVDACYLFPYVWSCQNFYCAEHTEKLKIILIWVVPRCMLPGVEFTWYSTHVLKVCCIAQILVGYFKYIIPLSLDPK